MIQVYSLKMERELTDRERQQIMNIVTPERKAKALRFRRFEDQSRGLLTGLLESYVFWKVFGIPNPADRILTGEQGKPYISEENGRTCQYNLSHSGNWIVCGVSEEALGIDVEQEAKYQERIVKRFFLKQEQDDIFGKEEAERPKIFAEYWTMKESVMKYTGLGFSLPLSSFLTNRETGCVTFLWNQEKKTVWQEKLKRAGITENATLFCQRMEIESGYACSICSRQYEQIEQHPLSVEKCLLELRKVTGN